MATVFYRALCESTPALSRYMIVCPPDKAHVLLHISTGRRTCSTDGTAGHSTGRTARTKTRRCINHLSLSYSESLKKKTVRVTYDSSRRTFIEKKRLSRVHVISSSQLQNVQLCRIFVMGDMQVLRAREGARETGGVGECAKESAGDEAW